MLLQEIKKIKSTPKELREFSFVVGGAILLLSGFAAWKHGAFHWGWPAAGLTLIALGLVCPGVLRPLQRAWMTLALAMGWVMSHVILTLIFCVVLTPLALALKIRGKRLMERGFDPKSSSYWHLRGPESADPKRCERQY